MCKRCGGAFGDPFNDISITAGVLTVDHFGGSNWKWSFNHKFRYQNDDFYLIGKTSNSYFGGHDCDKLNDFASTNFEDINYITGDRTRKKISDDCKLLLDKKDKIKTTPLKNMSACVIEN